MERRRRQRQLAAVLFTDIVDSTAVISRIGDDGWIELLDRHDDVCRDLIEHHGGTYVKSTGDGLLATFSSPTAAIECALALCAALEGCGVPIRAGLHLGEIEVRPDDVAGLAVHIAARVTSIAHKGEVLVTRTIADAVAGSQLSFQNHGQHELKGVDRTWELERVA